MQCLQSGPSKHCSLSEADYTHTRADGCRPQHPQIHKTRPDQLNVLDLYMCESVFVYIYICEIRHTQDMFVPAFMSVYYV